MSQSSPEFNFDQLTVPQRLELIGQLWDSIPDSEDALSVPEWHRRELDRRLTEADTNPEAGIPWETIQRRLRKAP